MEQTLHNKQGNPCLRWNVRNFEYNCWTDQGMRNTKWKSCKQGAFTSSLQKHNFLYIHHGYEAEAERLEHDQEKTTGKFYCMPNISDVRISFIHFAN